MTHPRWRFRGSAGKAHAPSQRLVVFGIAIPSIGALLKPFVTEAVFVLLCIAFLRSGYVAAFKAYLRRPAIVLAATAWTSLVVPALFGACCLAFGLQGQSPELFLGSHAAGNCLADDGSPCTGLLDGPRCHARARHPRNQHGADPLYGALVRPGLHRTGAHHCTAGAGGQVVCDPRRLRSFRLHLPAGLSVSLLSSGRKRAFDGFNILVLFVFVAAVMESVAARFLSAPMITIGT